MKINIIAAMSSNGVIGINNQLPWKISADLKRFKELTQNHTVVMGRKTYESIGKPLINRNNIVISRDPSFCPIGVKTYNSLDLFIADHNFNNDSIFVIGGAEIYKWFIDKDYVDVIYITIVDVYIKGDCKFPYITYSNWNIISQEFHKSKINDIIISNQNINFEYKHLKLIKK